MITEAAGHRRSRRLMSAGVSGLTGRLISVAVGLAATPVIVRSLGDVRYGVYATITMAVSLFSFSDLGVGKGLVTRLAAADGRPDSTVQRQLVSTAFAISVAVAAFLAVLALLVSAAVPWAAVFGSSGIPEAELRIATLIFGFVVAAGLPATLGQKILLGLQHGAVANAWLLATTVSALLLTVAASVAGASLGVVVMATTAPAVVLGAAQTMLLFRTGRPDLLPRRSDVTRDRVGSLLNVSGLFFLLNVAVAVAFQTDLLVVSAILGATSAAVFSIALRLFGLVTQANNAYLSQLWPAFAEALSAGDHVWVRRTLIRMTATAAAITAPAVAVLVLVGKDVIRWLVGPSLVPPTALLVALALWTLQQAVVYPTAMLMNGAEIVRFQLIAASAMAVANLLTSIWLTKTVGIAGPVWSSLITHTVLNAIPAMIMIRRRFFTEGRPPGATALQAEAVG